MRASQRRRFATVVATGVALAAAPGISQAQQSSYPSKPIRLVSSTTPGSQPDGIARMIGQKLSESWGRPVVIDNRPGAQGMLAAGMVAKAAPDGHTLLYVLPNFSISAALQPSLPYDPVKDFAGVIQIGFSTNVLVVTPTLGAKSVKDLVAIAKAQPGKIIFASSATGSAGHLTGARFNFITGIKVVHVAFKGGPDATLEILAGRSHYHVGTMGVTLPFIREGKLVALGVTTPQRAPDTARRAVARRDVTRVQAPRNIARTARARRDAASRGESDQQGDRAHPRSARRQGAAREHRLRCRTGHAG